MYRLGILSASWDEILAWDTRNETSYEETLHVAIAFNCAYYDLFYDLCFYVILFSDLSWDSLRHRGNGMGWSRAFGLDELTFSCFNCFLLAPCP